MQAHSATASRTLITLGPLAVVNKGFIGLIAHCGGPWGQTCPRGKKRRLKETDRPWRAADLVRRNVAVIATIDSPSVLEGFRWRGNCIHVREVRESRARLK